MQLQDLLSLKQQQASIAEAKESIKQGRAIMAFTIVTIFFVGYPTPFIWVPLLMISRADEIYNLSPVTTRFLRNLLRHEQFGHQRCAMDDAQGAGRVYV